MRELLPAARGVLAAVALVISPACLGRASDGSRKPNATAGAGGGGASSAGAAGKTNGTAASAGAGGSVEGGSTGHACATELSIGSGHACARYADGTLWCWGYNADGQVGHGSMELAVARPRQVGALGASVAEVAAGGTHTCARTDLGAIWCWGVNASGQLGVGPSHEESSYSPLPVGALDVGVVEVTTAVDHTCARKEDGTLWCWGEGMFGQLGDQPETNPEPLRMAALQARVAQVATGYAHTCALLRDGTLWCWGWNGEGQLGDGTTETPRLSPVQVAALGGTVARVTAGGWHTCAITMDGTLWCWGRNDLGQVGDGTTRATVASPVAIDAPGREIREVAAGRFHTCGRYADGTLWCWGQNEAGQIGDGTTQSPRPSPARVAALSVVTGVAAGGWSTCALDGDGAVWCWGRSDSGQLGDGSTMGAACGLVTCTPSPVRVALTCP